MNKQQIQQYVMLIAFALILFFGMRLFTGKQGEQAKDPRGSVGVLAELKNYASQERWQAIRKETNTVMLKDFPQSPEAPQALLLLAQTIEADAGSPTVWNGKTGNQNFQIPITDDNKLNLYREAVKTYKTLQSSYPNSPEWQNYGDRLLKQAMAKHDEVASSKKGFVLLGIQLPNQYRAIQSLVKFSGNSPWFSYTFAMFLLALLVRLILYPLSHIQFKSMKDMAKIQPLMREVQDKYKGEEQQKKMMQLYKEHNVNPMMSCFSMLTLVLQIPFFIWVYNAINDYQFGFQNGKFLWIGADMFKQWPSIVAPSLGEHDVPLLLIYSVSMYITSRLSVVDPAQADQQKQMSLMMSGVFLIMMFQWRLPSAFVLYWIFLNVLTTLQQYYIMKGSPIPQSPKPAIKDATSGSNGKGKALMDGSERTVNVDDESTQPKIHPKKKRK